MVKCYIWVFNFVWQYLKMWLFVDGVFFSLINLIDLWGKLTGHTSLLSLKASFVHKVNKHKARALIYYHKGLFLHLDYVKKML